MRVTGDTPNMFDIYGDCCSPVWGTQEEAPKKIAAIEGDMETAKAVWGTQEEACNETAAVEGDMKTAIQARIESKRKAALDRKEALDNIRQAPMLVLIPSRRPLSTRSKIPRPMSATRKNPSTSFRPSSMLCARRFFLALGSHSA